MYTSMRGLGIDTDLTDMISDDLPFHKRWKEYKKQFPAVENTIIVIVDGNSVEQTRSTADRITNALNGKPECFSDVLLLTGHPFVDERFLLYMDRSDVESFSSRWRELTPLIQAYAAKPTATGVLAISGPIIGQESGAPWARELARLFTAAANGEPGRLELSRLLKMPEQETRQFISVKPVMDFSKLLPAEPAVEALKSILVSDQPLQSPGIQLSLTGDALLSYEELKGVSKDAAIASALSMVLVAFILSWALRSIRLIVFSLANLTVGLILTSAFAAVAVGHLNLISIAFAVLFIGLGIDFSIHVCLRYRELLSAGEENQAALRHAVAQIGHSMFLCTVTTAAGFYAFVPTSYSGTSELGLIAGTGMLINFAVHMTLLPALLTLFPVRAESLRPLGGSLGGRLTTWSHRNVLTTGIIAASLLLLSLPFAAKSTFDANPMHLQNPNTEAFKVYQSLLEESERSPWTIKVLEQDPVRLEQIVHDLKDLEEVSRVVTLDDWIPVDQDVKLGMIRELQVPPLAPDKTEDAQEVWAALEILEQSATAGRNRASNPEHKAALDDLLHALITFGDTGNPDAPPEIAWIPDSLADPLGAFYVSLQQATSAGAVHRADLPVEIKRRYESPDGWHLAEIFPSQSLLEMRQMRAFASAVLQVSPGATDDPVTLPYSGDAVARAFIQATLTAALLIGFLVLLMTRKIVDSALVAVPILAAAILALAIMAAIGLSFNFANIIVVPLLIGLGVDSAIHLIHRFRTSDGADAVDTSTSRGIFFSTLTTIVSFGTLMISGHRGTASLGIFLVLGTALVMVSTLLLLPPLLKHTHNVRFRARGEQGK